VTMSTSLQEVLFATAGVPNERLDVFTEDALREMARSDPRCRYQERTKQLWITIPEPTNAVEEMFAAIDPRISFADVTPKCNPCKQGYHEDCDILGCQCPPINHMSEIRGNGRD
jgi:hypothetical protein